MSFKPLADRVLIKVLEGEEKTKSGIVIPDTAKEKPEKGKKNAGTKGQHNQKNHGNNGKRKADNSDFVVNTNVQGNAQRRKGKPPPA